MLLDCILALFHSFRKKPFYFFAWLAAQVLILSCLAVNNSARFYSASDFATLSARISLNFILLVSSLAVTGYFCEMPERIRMRFRLQRIGLKNHFGEYPYLIFSDRSNRLTVYHIRSRGIPLHEWEDLVPELENILNISISKLECGKTSDIILLYCTQGRFDYDTPLYWSTSVFAPDNRLVVGSAFGQPEYWDLSTDSHALIGGSTGSGKTYLLKHLLMQCIQKGYQVIIADFKGGVDFPGIWTRCAEFVTTIPETLQKLDFIVATLENRKMLLSKLDCKDIDAYNRNNNPIARIIFACDEVSELLSQSGLTKEEKDLIKKIERNISIIARMGRAFGIHLILATQRADADTLSGAIKNNITYRLAGKCDEVLSKITLDNTDAADRVPKDTKGVFLTHTGVLVKGYLFDEYSELINCVKEPCYE